MTVAVEPLQVPSLRGACITQLEHLILSGQLKIGERLPSERTLAAKLDVSRPVVHQALVDLTAKGLVEIVPRRGVFVTDFRRTGSCALLTSLLDYNEGELDRDFLQSLVDMRLLMETETARLAALNRTKAHIRSLEAVLEEEIPVDRTDALSLAELDFSFHLLIALASGNLMYPLIINSFKPVYTNITRSFFSLHRGNGVLEQVFAFHNQLVDAIRDRDSDAAAATMAQMLRHGAQNL